MGIASTSRALEFIEQARLPTPLPRKMALREPIQPIAFEGETRQGAVAGSEAMSFLPGVSAKRREALAYASLLAQLVAKKTVTDTSNTQAWYGAYFDCLSNLGWDLESRSFAEYHQESDDFSAHEAILQVAAALMGTTPAALALMKSTLDALKSMTPDSPWITIFDRDSQHAKAACFQVSVARVTPDNQFMVDLIAFALEATTSIEQILFFKSRSNEATLRHFSGKVRIDGNVLDEIREPIKGKVSHFIQDYIRLIPDLG